MGMGMDEYTTTKSYALRVERLLAAVKDLEDCALEFPETRDETIALLEGTSENLGTSGRVLRRAADEVAAVGMLEILHEPR